MALILLSLIVLWSAPLIELRVAPHSKVQVFFNRLLPMGIGLIVLFGIFPDSYAAIGWRLLPCAAAGMLVPSLVEHLWHRQAERIHWVALGLGIGGLALHAALDGAALIGRQAPPAVFEAVPLAVLGHRFFEGLFIWTTLRPRAGRGVALAVLVLDSLFTLLGAVAGEALLPHIHGEGFAGFQAVVGGSLLHLMVHRHHHHTGHEHRHHGHVHHGQRNEHKHEHDDAKRDGNG